MTPLVTALHALNAVPVFSLIGRFGILPGAVGAKRIRE